MPPETMTKDELRNEFEKSAREAIDDADFVDAKTARKIVDRRLQKAGVEEDDDDEGTAESVRDETDDLLDRLEEEGVPQDLIDACAEYIAAEEVEKALEVEQVDPELARRLQANEAILNQQIERAEKRQQARAEAVAAEAEAPIVDAVVYDEDE